MSLVCNQVEHLPSWISFVSVDEQTQTNNIFFLQRICHWFSCMSTTYLCAYMNFIQIIFTWDIFLYHIRVGAERVLLMASTNIVEKKTTTEEWDERMEHKKDDENVNAVSDKAKNVKQSWERECAWCGGRNHVCHIDLFGVAFGYLSLLHAAPFLECSLFILTRHFREKLSLSKEGRLKDGQRQQNVAFAYALHWKWAFMNTEQEQWDDGAKTEEYQKCEFFDLGYWDRWLQNVNT